MQHTVLKWIYTFSSIIFLGAAVCFMIKNDVLNARYCVLSALIIGLYAEIEELKK